MWGHLLETGLDQPPRYVHKYGETLRLPPEKVDVEGAVRAYLRSCELGYARGCLSASAVVRVQGDTPRATALAERAFSGFEVQCAAGSGEECELLGAAWVGNWGHTADPKVACQYFTRACELGDGRGCWQQGLCLSGYGGSVDALAAEAAFHKSCDALGAVVGCIALRDWYLERGNLEGSERYARRMCEVDGDLCPRNPLYDGGR